MLKISSYFKLNFIPSVAWLEHAESMLIGHPEQSDIFFFYKPLLDQKLGGKSAFYRLHPATAGAQEFEAVLLRFFLGYGEINILVVSQAIPDNLPSYKEALNERFETIWKYAKSLCASQPAGLEYLRRYSCWINSEFPVEYIDDFVEIFLADHNLKPITSPLISTEKGFWFKVTEPYHYALYERYILMYGLLLAYQISLELFINKLASFTIENADSIEQLRKECAEFNVIFYFTNPIKMGYTNIRPAWNKLKQPFGMEILTSEWMDQLEAVAQIYQIKQDRERREKEKLEEQERSRRENVAKEQEVRAQMRQNIFNFWLSIVGIILTALTIVEITPSELATFFQEWKAFFSGINMKFW